MRSCIDLLDSDPEFADQVLSRVDEILDAREVTVEDETED